MEEKISQLPYLVKVRERDASASHGEAQCQNLQVAQPEDGGEEEAPQSCLDVRVEALHAAVMLFDVLQSYSTYVCRYV